LGSQPWPVENIATHISIYYSLKTGQMERKKLASFPHMLEKTKLASLDE
jgi:hypothetical protein